MSIDNRIIKIMDSLTKVEQKWCYYPDFVSLNPVYTKILGCGFILLFEDDKLDNELSVIIAIDPTYRGFGLCSHLIKCVILHCKYILGKEVLYWIVHHNNVHSIDIGNRFGFILCDKNYDDDYLVLCKRIDSITTIPNSIF